MFRIDRANNTVEPLQSKSFTELGFQERAHLQEWVAKHPDCLDEPLLIIQKEFSGFDGTSERLDLLAVDKSGALVIIENKLDDSGRDVTWQALKYASYCSTLTEDGVRQLFTSYIGNEDDAQARWDEFFNSETDDSVTINSGFGQRIILLAANFRKEVTSVVSWLLNFNIRLQCMKATIHAHGEDLFLSVEQIIPVQDAEEYRISLALKEQEESASQSRNRKRGIIRREFWTRCLQQITSQTSLFDNLSTTSASYCNTTTSRRGIRIGVVATGSYKRAEIYVDTGVESVNTALFDELKNDREIIESKFGNSLVWEPLENRRAARIKFEQPGNVYDRETWDATIKFLSDTLIRLHKAFEESIKALPQQ